MPQQFQQLLIVALPFLIVAAFLWTSGNLAFMLWRRRISGPHFPNRNTVNILFDESWTSGNSHKSIFTRLGGATNCLRVTVTDRELWVTSPFPFSAFAAQVDLDHRIRRKAITKVERRGKIVQVTFALDDGELRLIALCLRNAERFCDALNADIKEGENGQ